jgi:hypothetical protein
MELTLVETNLSRSQDPELVANLLLERLITVDHEQREPSIRMVLVERTSEDASLSKVIPGDDGAGVHGL